ncbi:MAG: hypothetical protein AAFP15_08570 [Bacteroidota bacterium]
MNENTPNETNESGQDLKAVVTSYTRPARAPEGIPEDQQPYVKEILAMDAIRDVRGSLSDDNTERPSFKLKVEALPPQLQSEARERLYAMGNLGEKRAADAEAKVVSEIITSKLGSIRALTGVHPSSLPYHKEQAEIAAEVLALQQKRQGYIDGIEKVIDVRKATDPETGEVTAEPVYWLSQGTREKWNEQVDELDRRIRLLVNDDGTHGLEGSKRLDQALKESAALLHKRETEKREEAQAHALAEEMVSKERVAQRAEVLASMKRNIR